MGNSQTPKNTKDLSVLAIGPEPLIQKACSEHIRTEVTLTCHSQTEEGLESIQSTQFDCICLFAPEIHPEMVLTLQSIKHHIPIIFVCDDEDDARKRQAMEYGAQDILSIAAFCKDGVHSIKKAVLRKQKFEELFVYYSALEFTQRILDEKTDELEKEQQVKDQFLRNMSHELKTPLNSILILSKLFMDNPDNTLSPSDIESAEVIHRCGKDLLSLIDDILDLASIKRGKLTLHPHDILVHAFAEKIATSIRPLIDQKGLILDLQIASDIPETITSDAKRLSQIIRNFLSNAIKFSQSGTITLSFFNSETHKDHLAISVKDTGIGIQPDKLESIFEEFEQADGTINRTYGGTGLGLSISKNLIQLLGGKLAVSSTFKKGSTFTIFVPYVYKKVEYSERQLSLKTQAEAHKTLGSESPTTSPSIESDATIPKLFEGEEVCLYNPDITQLFALNKLLNKSGLKTEIADSIEQLESSLLANQKLKLLLIGAFDENTQALSQAMTDLSKDKAIILPTVVCLDATQKRASRKYLADFETIPSTLPTAEILDKIKYYLDQK